MPRRLIAFAVLSTFALQQQGLAQSRATLAPSGYVTINSSIVNQQTLIISGDQIQTGAKSAASVTAPGTLLTVTPNSAFSFQGDAIQAGCGGFSVVTRNGFIVRAGDVDIVPDPKQQTKFKVVQGRGKIAVQTEEGAVSLVRGASTKAVAVGSMAVEKTTACLNLGPVAPTAMAAVFGSSLTALIVGITAVPKGRPISPSKP